MPRAPWRAHSPRWRRCRATRSSPKPWAQRSSSGGNTTRRSNRSRSWSRCSRRMRWHSCGSPQAQFAVKDYSGAIASERTALALKPDLPQAYDALARTYLASGNPDAALAEAHKLQKDQPDKAHRLCPRRADLRPAEEMAGIRGSIQGGLVEAGAAWARRRVVRRAAECREKRRRGQALRTTGSTRTRRT